MKQFVLLDHDGVLVDTEPWYFEAGRRALAEIGFPADLDDYLSDMAQGRGTWARARAAGVTDEAIDRARSARDSYYQEYLRTEDLEIEGVLDVLTELFSELTALERVGASADAALVVEDSARGLASAVAAGIDCCVVHHDFTASQELSSADYRIDAIGDLSGLLASSK